MLTALNAKGLSHGPGMKLLIMAAALPPQLR
jgi:hypothetical protein